MHDEVEETQAMSETTAEPKPVEINLPGEVPDTIIVNGQTYERRQFSDYCFGANRAIEEVRILAEKNGLTLEEAKSFYFAPFTLRSEDDRRDNRNAHMFWRFMG